jgi:hypothetical protein
MAAIDAQLRAGALPMGKHRGIRNKQYEQQASHHQNSPEPNSAS